jgi:hypothetical protein
MTTTYVETRMIDLGELTMFPGNARRGNRAKLLESLEANGQYRSLIVRDTGDELVILAGNNTYEALEERGDPRARCEIVTCDDQTALRVNLVDNKANDEATYDDRARAELVSLLDGLDGSGYEEDEVDALLARFEEEEITDFQEPEVSLNDDAAERVQRVKSHGGPDSATMESRGIRDIFIPLPVAQADELGRLIMALRETWGALPQGEILLKAARVARAALGGDGFQDVTEVRDAADLVYEAEADE